MKEYIHWAKKIVTKALNTDIISEGALKGLSRETIEKDSNGVSIKTIDSYVLDEKNLLSSPVEETE